MATKKSGPTLAALNAQIAALQAQADALRKKEAAEVVAKIKDAISHYGLTAADLGLATGARKSAKSPAAGGGKPASKRRKKAGPKPAARTVKFGVSSFSVQ
jgi:DNA-binding protein H-NS